MFEIRCCTLFVQMTTACFILSSIEVSDIHTVPRINNELFIGARIKQMYKLYINQLTLKCTTPTPLILNASPDVTTP